MKITRKQLRKIISETIYLPSDIDVSEEAMAWNREMRALLSQKEREAADRHTHRGGDHLRQGLSMGGSPKDHMGPEKKTKTFLAYDEPTINHMFQTGTFDYSMLDQSIADVIQERMDFFKMKIYPGRAYNDPSFLRGLKRFLYKLPPTAFLDLFTTQPMGANLLRTENFPKFIERMHLVIDREVDKLSGYEGMEQTADERMSTIYNQSM